MNIKEMNKLCVDILENAIAQTEPHKTFKDFKVRGYSNEDLYLSTQIVKHFLLGLDKSKIKDKDELMKAWNEYSKEIDDVRKF